MTLGEIITAESFSSEQPSTTATIIPVNDIVSNTKLAHVSRLTEIRENIEKAGQLSALSQIQKMSSVTKDIFHILRENNNDVQQRLGQMLSLTSFTYGNSYQSSTPDVRAMTISLVQGMVEQYYLTEKYRNEIAQLHVKLSSAKDEIRDLQQDLLSKPGKSELKVGLLLHLVYIFGRFQPQTKQTTFGQSLSVTLAVSLPLHLVYIIGRRQPQTKQTTFSGQSVSNINKEKS